MTKTKPTVARAHHASVRPSAARRRCSGVTSSSPARATRPAILPTSVFIPVAVTTATAHPVATFVPRWTTFERSASGASERFRACASFATGDDSPVSAASLVRSTVLSMSRESAGTTSPLSSRITSPGTSSAAPTTRGMPARRTRAERPVSLRSAASARSARYSCVKPMTAFTTRIAPIAEQSAHSPDAPEISAAASRITISTLLNCAANRASGRTGFESAISLGPNAVMRRETSASSSPRALDPSVLSVSSTDEACHARDGAVSLRTVRARPGSADLIATGSTARRRSRVAISIP